MGSLKQRTMTNTIGTELDKPTASPPPVTVEDLTELANQFRQVALSSAKGKSFHVAFLYMEQAYEAMADALALAYINQLKESRKQRTAKPVRSLKEMREGLQDATRRIEKLMNHAEGNANILTHF